nr:GNAT family protein [Ruminococcus sp.]
MGYCLGYNWWHKGIMSEAFKEIIRFLFEDVGLNRIEAYHDPRNPHSGDVMKKCGLLYEGTARQAGKNMQGICDNVHYAILKEDYFAE